jgi:curved DNA-binding protein CbpA
MLRRGYRRTVVTSLFAPVSASRLLFASRFCSSSAKAPVNPFTILGLDPSTADEAAIKKQHRMLVRTYHPDNKETGDEKKFLLVQGAFEQLRDNDWKYAGPAPAPGATAYEPPGTTTDTYVNQNPKLQAYVRIVVVWMLFVAATRFVMTQWLFQDVEARRRANEHYQQELARAAAANGSSPGAATSGTSSSSSSASPQLPPEFQKYQKRQDQSSSSFGVSGDRSRDYDPFKRN